MANQDFLITFSVDGTQALHMMDQIGQRATALEARLNALGRGSGGTTSGGLLKSMGIAPAAVNQSVQSIADLEKKLGDLRAAYRATRDASMRISGSTSGKAFAFSPTGRAMQAEINQARDALEALKASASSVASGGGRRQGPGIIRAAGLAPDQLRESERALNALSNRVARTGATLATNQALGIATPANFKAAGAAAFNLGQSLGGASAKGAQLVAQGQALVAQGNQLAASMKAQAAATQQASSAFSNHTIRILEAILIYEAFGRAVQAVKAGIDLIIDIDRESRRLEAVLQVGPEQSAEFVRALGQVASETVTPIADLVAESDRASAAFLDVEDPAEQAAASLELMNRAGQFTSVTQRDLGIEITNLIAIMKQFDIPIGEMGDRLGQLVVAGGNSSTIIAGLADALQISSRAASQAGVDFEVLAAISAEFLIQTGRGGTEVGNIFKLLFQRLSDPGVAENVSDITGGLLKMRDAAGAIRDPIQIMLELNALLDENVITATQFRDVLDTMAPPLNPAAKADFILINDLLGEIGPKVAEIGAANVSNLDLLVAHINDNLGAKFQKLIIDAQNAFVDLFSDDVLAGGQGFIDLMYNIGRALASLPPGVLEAIVKFGLFVGALKVVTFFGGRLITLFGLGGVAGSLRILAATAAGAFIPIGAQAGAAAKGVQLLGSAMIATRTIAVGLMTTMAPLLVALAAFMAIDFAGKVQELQGGLRGQIGESLVGLNVQQLQQRRAEIEGNIAPPPRIGLIPDVEGIAAQFANLPLIESMQEIDRLISELGPHGVVTAEMLGESFQQVEEDSFDLEAALAEQQTAFEQAQADADAYAESLSGMTDAERLAALAATIFTGLADEQADAINTLTESFKRGRITQDEYTQGLQVAQQAQDLAAQLTAAYGDQLRTLIPELANAAVGQDGLAAALFELLIHSGDSITGIGALITQLVNLATTEAAVAATVRANPIVVTTVFTTVHNDVRGGFFSGDDPQTSTKKGRNTVKKTTTGPNINAQMQALFQALIQQIRNATSKAFGFSPSAAAPKPVQQTPILDIGDLTPAQVAQLIQIATALRNAIPGETAASKDDIVALIKDGKFLQTIKGIDERLLRIAMEQLTDEIEEANRLEQERLQKEAVLKNLVVNAGPLGALVSQPSLFGVAGALAGGTGLNFDPTQGNFVINVPIELQGLEPAALQQLIYDIISKAIRDATRT